MSFNYFFKGYGYVPQIQFSPSANDQFNQANSTSSLGPNWTNRHGVMGIINNGAYGVTGSATFNTATYNTVMTSDDQVVSVTLGTFNGSNGANDAVWCLVGASSGGTEYVIGYFRNGTPIIYSCANWNPAASPTIRATGTATSWTVGDTLSIQRVGIVYTLLKNGVALPGASWADNGNVVTRDADHRLVGIGAYNNAEYRIIDEWASGNYSGSASLQLAGVTYTQSNVFASNSAATYTNMNNNNADGSANGGETGLNQVANNFVKADAGTSKYITHIVIGYDYLNSLPGTWGVSYTEGLSVQGSTDNSSWTTVATTPSYAATGSTNGLVTVPVQGTWRYVRLFNPATQYMAVIEFQLWGY
jgi:hypothetical protein